jgi:hypothetical protein
VLPDVEKRKRAIDLKRQDMSYQAVALEMGISRQRVQQLTRPPKPIKEAILLRAKGKCEECGAEIGRRGEFHHKNEHDYDWNDISNIDYLCKTCHLCRRVRHHKGSYYHYISFPEAMYAEILERVIELDMSVQEFVLLAARERLDRTNGK